MVLMETTIGLNGIPFTKTIVVVVRDILLEKLVGISKS
jgi:hypothetical protein